jgi:hypothetical protein
VSAQVRSYEKPPDTQYCFGYNDYGIKVGLSIKLSSASVVNQMISIQDFISKYNSQGVEVE